MKNCEAGCKSLTCGSIRHIKECVNYPESLSEMLDKAENPPRRRTNMLFGMFGRPCASDEKENEEIMQSSDYSVSKDFRKEYCNHIAGKQIVAECAKIYIMANYEKVKDWTGLDVVIEDNQGWFDYYNYSKREIGFGSGAGKATRNVFANLDERNKDRHNPIITLTDCVLDTTDGDFSLTINGKEHWWISDDSVIVISEFIEKNI